MMHEGVKFRLWFAPDLTAAEFQEAASSICRVLVAGPPEPPGHRRRVAVRTALNLYEGSPSRRAKQLEQRYRAYLASGWLRERDMGTIPEPRSSTERVLLHRLARLNGGRSLSGGRFFASRGRSPGARHLGAAVE